MGESKRGVGVAPVAFPSKSGVGVAPVAFPSKRGVGVAPLVFPLTCITFRVVMSERSSVRAMSSVSTLKHCVF